jgi:hypothetical protein
MKTRSIVFLVLLGAMPVFSQLGVPHEVENALFRIENAFEHGSPGDVEDLLSSSITMRLADSLYQGISSIQAMNLLKDFFADKDSIDFRFTLPGNGTMIYLSGGKRDTTQVDVWLRGRRDELGMYAINISNYPTATVFYNIPRKKEPK